MNRKDRKLMKRLDTYCDTHMTECENCPLNTLARICDADVWSEEQKQILHQFLKIRGY